MLTVPSIHTQEDLNARIRAALSEVTGAPIKKDRIVRQFAAKLLHGELGEGRNEHNLDAFFSEVPAQPKTEIPEELYVLVWNETSNDEQDINQGRAICMTRDSLEKKMMQVMVEEWPDHDESFEEFLEVDEVREVAEDYEGGLEAFTSEFADSFDVEGMLEAVVDQLGIDAVKDIFCQHILYGRFYMSYTVEQVS